MNNDLRNTLWNILDLLVWQKEDFLSSEYGEAGMEGYSKNLWFDYFKQPIDTCQYYTKHILDDIRTYFFAAKWYEVYDFIEFTLNYFNDKPLTKSINAILERELSGYRYISGIFTDITSEQEIEMLEGVLSDTDFPGVSSHLRRSLELLSDRETPDYRNSIKESISAVESFAMTITCDESATLGQALKVIDKENNIHPALKDAFSKLYGYASDKGGIRHAMLEEPKLSSADAKFFLMSCTSFINYMKSKL
ncbi:MAG: hypothetical protein MUO58_14515 [Anaerolineales bacterium]|nr:hypothetical protein [Anaerolineales bacterium]